MQRFLVLLDFCGKIIYHSRIAVTIIFKEYAADLRPEAKWRKCYGV